MEKMSSELKLTYRNRVFWLNGKPLRIFSGAIHYFRVFPGYWQDRLNKAKACGLNTIETYVAWNLHEPAPGTFKCDGILDLRKFIQQAHDLGLYIILRPGPYICSEWDFGGLPSWLLADENMQVRSNYPGYVDAVKRYFSWLLPRVLDLQHCHGGPIIAVQVENEFGSFSDNPEHMILIRDLLLQNGVVELLVSCDNESAAGTGPIVDGVLPMANGQTVDEVKPNFDIIKKLDADFPLMVMEFWTGWFDHWGFPHESRGLDVLQESFKYCLKEHASVNFYMFHGGTNFGFMSGALNLSKYKADTTSYDYDAPLSEQGVLTEKALNIREMIQQVNNDEGLELAIPELLPPNPRKGERPLQVQVHETIPWQRMVTLIHKVANTSEPAYMESFTYGDNGVQSYGYIIYRKEIRLSGETELVMTGPVRDRAIILVDGVLQTVVSRADEEPHPSARLSEKDATYDSVTLDIVVENLGRVNYTTKDRQDEMNNQRKGLNGPVKCGDEILKDWTVFALDFDEHFINQLSDTEEWSGLFSSTSVNPSIPGLFRARLELQEQPQTDFFINMEGWGKGIVIVNGFNLGRYWDVGPTRTLYLPAPLLKAGVNHIIIFEEAKSCNCFTLDVEPNLG